MAPAPFMFQGGTGAAFIIVPVPSAQTGGRGFSRWRPSDVETGRLKPRPPVWIGRRALGTTVKVHGRHGD